jgi:virginiamycin A acetyltransferase
MLNSILFELYKIRSTALRRLVIRLACRFERGEFYSRTLRRIFREYHDVNIGMYSQGGCFVPGAMDRHTTIGRYCSIAQGVRTMNRNHPMDYKSTHAFFFNPRLGYCGEDRIEYTPLSIGNDVWIGANALVLPHAKSIGDGAVIAAGAVVNKDVPPYAVVVGNPARVVRFRFPKEVIDQLLASRWWEKSLEDLNANEFTMPFLTGSASVFMTSGQNILAES